MIVIAGKKPRNDDSMCRIYLDLSIPKWRDLSNQIFHCILHLIKNNIQ